MKLKKNVEKVLNTILIVMVVPLIMIQDFELSALPILLIWVTIIILIALVLIKYGKLGE